MVGCKIISTLQLEGKGKAYFDLVGAGKDEAAQTIFLGLGEEGLGLLPGIARHDVSRKWIVVECRRVWLDVLWLDVLWLDALWLEIE